MEAAKRCNTQQSRSRPTVSERTTLEHVAKWSSYFDQPLMSVFIKNFKSLRRVQSEVSEKFELISRVYPRFIVSLEIASQTNQILLILCDSVNLVCLPFFVWYRASSLFHISLKNRAWCSNSNSTQWPDRLTSCSTDRLCCSHNPKHPMLPTGLASQWADQSNSNQDGKLKLAPCNPSLAR